MGIFQSDRLRLLFLVVQEGDCHLVSRPFLRQVFLKLGNLGDILLIHLGDDVAFLYTRTGGCASFFDGAYINAFIRTQVYTLVVFLFVVDVVQNVTALDTENRSLYGAVLLQVCHNLVHDCRGDGEAVATVRPCL